MAIRESRETLGKSGWSLTVIANDDVDGWVEEVLAAERKRLTGNMSRGLDHIVRAVQKTLSRQYPLLRSGSRLAGIADTMMRAIRSLSGGRDVRQSSTPPDSPGRVMGDLMASWQVGRVNWNGDKTVLTGRYFSDHPGAGAHEFGAPPGTGIWINGLPARPYVRPTLLREADALDRILMGEGE